MITFYQALESASITNELVQTDEQQGRIVGDAQVDALPNANDNDSSNDTSKSNNDTATTIPTTRVTDTSLESVTTDASPIATVETTQTPETTVRQDDSTQSVDLATTLPETTETTRADTTALVEESPSTTPPAEVITDPSTVPTPSPDDSTGTNAELTPEVTTETVTKPPTLQNAIPEANASSQMTAIPSIVDGAYSDITESSLMTTEQIGEITTSTDTNEVTDAPVVQDTASTTEQNDQSTTLVTGRIVYADVDSRSSLTSESDVTTTIQPSLESTSTMIATTAESVTLQLDSSDVTTEVPSDLDSTTSDAQITTTDGVSNLEVTVEMATSTLPTTVPTPESTEASTATMAVSDDQSSTTGTLEITTQLGESATTPQATESRELEVTSSTVSTNSSDSQTTDVTTSSAIPRTESSLRDRINLDDIGARLGNYTDIPSLSDNSLLSRMMIRLMTTLFSDSSEETGRPASESTPTVDVMTTRAPGATGQIGVDEVPQLLGGFLDNTDKNATSEVASGSKGVETTSTPGTTSPVSEPPSTQPDPETTTTITEQPITEPVVTSTRVTTPSTTPVTLSPLDETTLTPVVTVAAESERTQDDPEDLTSTPAMDDTNFTTNQPSESTLTTSDTVEQTDMTVESETGEAGRLTDGDVAVTGVTTVDNGVTSTNNNNVPDMTTPITDTSPEPQNDDPNSLAGFQDTTTATAQRTAGDDAQATTRPEQTTVSVTTPIPETTTTVTETTTSVTTTQTQSSTSSTETPAQTTLTDSPTEQTTAAEETTTMGTTLPVTSESPIMTTSESTTTASMDMATTTTASSVSTESPTTTTTMNSNDTVSTTMTASPATSASPATTQYLGRFGNSRITPAPRFSVSSSTTTPLRDYLVYGIYPNKTIVRKRPEDNLIDARNVDSPYVIFGIFPDGRLVRKFPNGTVIPDPPTNPVEVVFSLKTTTSTTNRPRPPVFIDNRQSNPGYYYNQNALYNNPGASILASPGGQPGDFPTQVDLGLTGNAIGPGGEAPNYIASQPSGTKMVFRLLLSQSPISLVDYFSTEFR